MGSNSFGRLFQITTWGESHGKAIGVVIDGCPAGLSISEEEINEELKWRRPGSLPFTSPRKESDEAEILSGVFEGQTTGTPLSIMIRNRDAKPHDYAAVKDVLRPGHANFTYLEKYGIYDYRGVGRASARETACRVAAGAIAKKLLMQEGIELAAYLSACGSVESSLPTSEVDSLREQVRASPLFCPDESATQAMTALLIEVEKEGDSLGGMVTLMAEGLPPGLGEPIFDRLEARLAAAMLSLPASKGFEMGCGMESARMRGSVHNDLFEKSVEGKTITKTNYAGGTLGGLSSGMPLVARVAFKPPSSIRKPQETLDLEGEKAVLELPKSGRYDPCVAIRAVPVVEAMGALVLADFLLLARSAKL